MTTTRNKAKFRGHFAASKDAKKAGWHSRRHQTRRAQDAARARYQAGSRA